MPIRIRDGLGVNLRLLGQPVRLRPRNVNDPVDDRVRDVHALGTEFPSERLREGAQGELHGREGGEERGAFDGGCGAREDEGGWVCGCGWVCGGEEEGEGCLGEEEGSFAEGGGEGQPLNVRRYIANGKIRFVCLGCHLHAPSITRIHNLLRQLQKRLSNKCPTGIEYRRGALDIVPMFILHFLNHTFHALGVRDIGRYANRFTARLVDSVDDGNVGVWVAREDNDRVCGGEFAGDGCAGL